MTSIKMRLLAKDFAYVAGLGLLIGLVGALGASGFTFIADNITSLWLAADDPDSIAWRGWPHFGKIFLASLFAAFLIRIIWRFAKPPWNGPEETILLAQYPDHPFSFKHALLSTWAALVSICGGASVGQYGPLVVLGSSIALWMGRRRKFDASTRQTLLAAGAAAAISAAFGAPLGGMIFAHEVILRHYRLRSFATVAMASSMAYGSTFLIGGRADFSFESTFSPVTASTYLVLIFVGIFSGLVAFLSLRSFEIMRKFTSPLSVSPFVLPVFACFLLALVGGFVPQALGLGTETILAALGGKIGLTALAIILLAKIFLTGLSFAGGFHGGLFSPSLVIGAAFGGVVALAANAFGLGDGSQLAIFVYGGMGAVVSAVIGGPLTTIIVIYELTRSHDIAAAVGVSIVLSNLVVSRFYGRSVFDVSLLRRGHDLRLGLEERILHRDKVEALLERYALVLPKNLSNAEALARFDQAGQKKAFVVDDRGVLLGQLDLARLVVAKMESGFADLVHEAPSFSHDLSQLEAMGIFKESKPDIIAVTDHHGKFLGTVSAASLLSAYAAAHESH